MKQSFGVICLLMIIFSFTVSPSLSADEHDENWSKSYESYRQHFKSLSPSDAAHCEKLLKELLSDLDTKNQCNGDDDCVLIDQNPFGATVPFPKRLSEIMKGKMKVYCERCDDGSFHSIKSDNDAPVCWKGKCIVKSGVKKNQQEKQ